MPNPALENDMKKYKLKIERKFADSLVNRRFKMPLLPKPQKPRYVPQFSKNINSQRSSS